MKHKFRGLSLKKSLMFSLVTNSTVAGATSKPS